MLVEMLKENGIAAFTQEPSSSVAVSYTHLRKEPPVVRMLLVVIKVCMKSR